MNIIQFDETIDMETLDEIYKMIKEHYSDLELIVVPKGIDFMTDVPAEELFNIGDKIGVALEKIKEKGVGYGEVTLHVGLGTFRPVKADNILEHHMHSEFCMIDENTARVLNETKEQGGRIICVGTTSCRTLESLAGEVGRFSASQKWTDIFIYPGYQFKAVDALITNFHLPESTLVMLVSAFAGREHVLSAYEQAVQEKYRFFSFGDAMFIG